MSFKFVSLKSVTRSLLAGIGIFGLAIAGCTPQRNFETETPPATNQDFQASAPENQTTTNATAEAPTRRPDVIYVPTPTPVVNEMLRLADVQADDVVYDLGSGDGRIVIAAAQERGARGVGIDIDPQLVQKANENAQQAGVSDRVEFRQQDLFETDFSSATVVTLYLLPELNVRLRPRLLQELRPGTRIVSHAFDMGEWDPEQVVQVGGRTVYYWTVPENLPENLL
ncbi:SAM-dependent methyltransferase [Leptolyngbya ohadii]|uniref:SAM-dependent methyltransferase n=1 Tax=Leptolyngbya ohadii TaxID=1962290 RepID=UPI001CEC02F0|nr:class I SAM-dependent methyltransferase [Leptolyngbya ohadii]